MRIQRGKTKQARQFSSRYTFKPVLRGHLWDKENVVFYDRWLLNRVLIFKKFSMTNQEKDDVLIDVTA